MVDERKKVAGRNLESDMAWCKKRMLAGEKVFCVRTRRGGLVVTFLASKLEKWQAFDGAPLDEFTVTPMMLQNGEVRFGEPGPWPREEGH